MPCAGDSPRELLEPYFFDFHGDLYGQAIAVELIDFIRPEAKFASLDALKAQMAEDVAAARRRLNPCPSPRPCAGVSVAYRRSAVESRRIPAQGRDDDGGE